MIKPGVYVSMDGTQAYIEYGIEHNSDKYWVEADDLAWDLIDDDLVQSLFSTWEMVCEL